jgi:hypothetical protein
LLPRRGIPLMAEFCMWKMGHLDIVARMER